MRPNVGRMERFARGQPRLGKWRTPALVFTVVWVAAAGPLAWAKFTTQRQEEALLATQTAFASRVAAKSLREHLMLRITAASTLVAEARASRAVTADLRAKATALFEALPGMQAVNWIDPSGHIAWVVPESANVDALGKSPLDSPLAKPSFEAATRSRQPRVTGPLRLFQGGTGVAVYLPIEEPGSGVSLGTINVVFRVDTLAEVLFDSYTNQYFDLALLDGSEVMLAHGNFSPSERGHAIEAIVDVLNARWRLMVEPNPALLASLRHPFWGSWTWLGLLSTFGLAAFAARYTFVSSERKRRNAALERANEILMQAAALVGLDATLDGEQAKLLVKSCCSAMGVTRAALWQYEARNGSVNLIAMFDERVGRFFSGVKIYAADYPEYWGAMLRDGRVVVTDAAIDPVTRKLHAERMPNLGRMAMLDVGIRAQGQVLGLFSFHRVGTAGDFSPEQRLLAQSMADLFALSWERADRMRAQSAVSERNERLARHANGLGKVAALLDPETPFDAVIAEVVGAVAEALGPWSVTYWSLGDEAQPLAAYNASGAPVQRRARIAPGRYPSIEARVATQPCVVVDDLAADPDYIDYYRDNLEEYGKISALQGVISSRQKPVGLLSVLDRERTHGWYPEDPIFVSSVANMLSLHWETLARRAAEAALSDQVASLTRHSVALADIAKAWLGGGGHAESLAKLTELAGIALQSTSASIWLEDRPGIYRLVERYYTADGRREVGEELKADLVPEYHERIVNERCVSVVDGANDPSYRRIHAHLFRDEPLVSVMASAVRQKGVPVGLVSFLSLGKLRQWTLDEQLFTAALADLVSLGLEQAARRYAERQMRQSQQRTNLLIEGTPLAAIDWSTDGVVVGWNPAAERLLGFTRAEALGLAVSDLFAEDRRVGPDEGWQELKSGVNLVERIRTRTKDGRALICDWRNTLLCDDAGRELGIMSLVEDVTARVLAEEEIRQLNVNLERRVTERTSELAEANQQLRELDRLKNEFLATMSHELRTPLNSVIGFSSILKAGMAGPINDEQGRQLDMINQSARHLLGLINDLLDLSRIEAGQVRLAPTEFDPAAVLDDVERTLRPMIDAKAGHTPFRFSIVNNAVGTTIFTDRTRLLQILINLANNAVKFTSEGSVVVELSHDTQGLRFDVRDTGPGISAENLKHLFEAFRQIDGSARRAYEGTGLGLYLCKKLSALLGGTVRVQSELGVGSCFSLWLPLRCTTCAS